jgi:hypothetical protein
VIGFQVFPGIKEAAMKLRMRHLMAILALLLAFAAVPAQADAPKAEVSGVCYFVDDGERPANFREWLSAHDTVYHLRNHAIVMGCDLSDDRLDGVLTGTNSWNGKWGDMPALFVGNEHVDDIAMTDGSGQTLWWGSSTGHYYPDGSYSSKMILHGAGPNEGMVAHLTWTWNWEWMFEGLPYQVEGVIIETGK